MLSAIIIAKNEEHNLRRCLLSLQWVDEIIVLDSGSTDNTVQIAKEFTNKVYETDWQGYGVQKQRALSYASGDWVLNIDADESVSDELKHAMMRVMAVDSYDAFRIPIRMFFYNKLLRYSSSPTRHIRLFKKQGTSYSNDIVHEKIVLAKGAKIGRLKAPLVHHSFKDVSHVLEKINRYSSYSAKIKLNNKKPASLSKTMFGSCWMFFRSYLLQGGFLDGKAGLVFALFNAQGTMYRGLKQVYPDCDIAKLPNILEDQNL